VALPVIEQVPFNLPTSGVPELDRWAVNFAREMVSAFREHGTRINLAITNDGETPMEAPFILGDFTIATLPSAANFERGIVYVSDGAVGQKFRGSDGAAWVNLG